MTNQVSTGGPNRHNRLTGLLLGAGASYDIGMPLLLELTHELKSWLTPDKLRNLNQHWRRGGTEFGYPDHVIEDFASVLDREDMHYESILGYLQAQSRRDPDTLQAYYGLYLFLSGIIYALLQERHLLNIGYIERNIRYLDGIKAFVGENAPLWIFSLNHDLIIECFAADTGIPLKSGFTDDHIRLPRRNPEGAIIGDLMAELLPEDVLKTQGLPFYRSGQTGINLLKIHGSLDIFTQRDGRDVLKLLPVGEGVQGVLSSLRIANHELKYVSPGWPGGEVTGSNEIIYADHSGEMQFLRRSLLAGAYKFASRHSQVVPNELLDYFRSNLNYLTRLVCIGYGFGDQHINQVIRDWLEFSSGRRLTIVDPNADHVPNDFLHVAPQIDLELSKCTDYLDQEGGIVREPVEHVTRQFGAWKRKKGTEADTVFSEFRKDLLDQHIERAAEWAKGLPIRDGDIDLEALGKTVEELSKELLAELAIPSPVEVLERFLEEQSNRDRQELLSRISGNEKETVSE